MNNWLNHHIQAIKLVLTRMLNNKLSSLMVSLVMGIAICLPGLFYISVDNLSKLTNHMQDETEISLFLKLGSNADDRTRISSALAGNAAIRAFQLVTKDEAWQRLQAKSASDSNIDKAIQQLNKNPLPDAFFIQAKSNAPEALEALTSELQQIPGVEQAVLNTEWAKRLASLIELSKKIIFFIAALLAVALLVIIGNTVRMQVITQKDEIEVSNLMGASSHFIRLPFLYSGLIQGLLGGVLTLLIMAIIIQIFNTSVADISRLYSTDFSLPLFNLCLSSAIIGAAMAIGWLGSYIAVSRSIASIAQGQYSR